MTDGSRIQTHSRSFLSSDRALAGVWVLAVLAIAALWWQVFDRHSERQTSAIDSWLDLEAEIVGNASRAAFYWIEERTTNDNLTFAEAEKEVFRLFIEPIQISKQGDAWIYNRNYVIFDKSEDFPIEYAEMAPRAFFERQKANGAEHFEQVVEGIENATTGTGWYIWLPEKGREFAAWSSIRIDANTWTIGLSTPENEIMEVFGVPHSFQREIILAGFISVLLVALLVTLFLMHRADIERLSVLNESNAQLERAVAERTKQLEMINEDLKRSNQDLEQFAYSASHDLRAPLRTISGFLTLLRTRYAKNLPKEGLEFIGHAVDGITRMNQQVEGLLEFSRVSTAGHSMIPVPLAPVLSSALANLRGAIEDSGAVISVPDDLPTVMADASQLIILFQNLIGNAIKYRHPDRTPAITITVKPAGARWLVEVADNGIGILPKFQERIFGVFQRLHGPDAYEGTGIGLALAKRIAERHGGSIFVQSDGESGSVFSVTLTRLG